MKEITKLLIKIIIVAYIIGTFIAVEIQYYILNLSHYTIISRSLIKIPIMIINGVLLYFIFRVVLIFLIMRSLAKGSEWNGKRIVG